MRRIMLFCSLCLLSAVSQVHALTHITTTSLPATATWGPTGSPADNEYWVEPVSGAAFTIPAGITLTIQPGTTVRLNGGISLIVTGALSASGTSPNPITFDVTPSYTQWGGITIATSGSLALSGCIIQNFGTNPIYGTAPQVAGLFQSNTFVPRADGQFNAIKIRGSTSPTVASNLTLVTPDQGFCYLMDGNPLIVSGTAGPVLTIEDRTIIKFQPTDYLQIAPSNTGGLRAKGVVFTSSQDDTLGDATGNGVTTGAPNQWRNLRFEAGTLAAQTVVDSCVVRYGGDTDGFGVLARSAQPTLTRCVIERMQGVGLYVDGSSTGQQITSNLLRNSTTWEMEAPPVAMANLLPANTVMPSGDSKYDAYVLKGATLTATLTLPRPPVGFCYLTDGNPLIVAGAGGPVLTIANLTVIKFQPADYLQIAPSNTGGLRAKGVVFTSSQDDTLGDATGNGVATGAPNQWRNLRFEAGTLAAQTVVDSCMVRYGGDTDGFGVLARSAQPTLTRCVIERMQGVGLYVDGSSTGQQITGNLLRNSTTWEMEAPPVAMANLLPANTVMPSGDGKYDAYVLKGATLTANLTLPRPPVGFCYLTDGNPLIVAGAGGPVLTIANLTVIKFQPADYLLVAQSNTGGLRAKGVVFTSSQDDTLGDTTGNGPTTGAPNQWRNLRFEAGTLAAQTVVDSCMVRYGGDTDGFGVLARSAQPTLTRCVIERMQGVGLYVDGSSTGQQITGNLLRNSTAWEMEAPPVAMANLLPANTVMPSDDGKYDAYVLKGTTLTANLTLPRPPVGFCYLTDGNPLIVAGAGGPVLTIANLTVIKFQPADYLQIAPSNTGGLRAKGVVFTSSQDDTLGDATGNGETTGAPNQWRNLRFEAGTLAAQTVVDSCMVRYGGDTDGFGVLVRSAQPTLTRCVIERMQGVGLYVDGSSTGQQVTGNLLRNSTTWEMSGTLAALMNLVPNNKVTDFYDGRYNGYHLQGGTASGALTLPRPPVGIPYYMAGSITIPAGSSLDIPAGVTIKMTAGTRLLVSGTLMTHGRVDQKPYAPVVFTSYRDDSWWGDTNGDGATVPAAGDWQRVEITGGNNASVIRGTIFEYGANGALGQLYVNATGTQAAPNVLIKDCHFRLGSLVGGVRTLNSNARLDSCSFFGTSGFLGVSNATPAVSVVASNSWWGDPTGPLDASVADPCSNPGGLGVGVSDFVNYCPFLTAGARVTDVSPASKPVTRSAFVSLGPVPSSGGVTMVVDVAKGSPRQLDVIDILGRKLTTFDLSGAEGRSLTVRWDGRGTTGGRVPPGLYFVRYRHEGSTETRRVILSK